MTYSEIFEGIATGIAASSIFTPVKYAVEQYMIPGKKATEDPLEQPLVSIPLAIGYYYNMIEKVEGAVANGQLNVTRHVRKERKALFDQLKITREQMQFISFEDAAMLKSNQVDTSEFLGEFPIDNVHLKLIYPADLDNRSTNNCSKYLRNNTKRGSVASYKAGRSYGLNYVLENQDSLTIVDYTRPVEAILKFYNEVHGIGGLGTDNSKWAQIEEREMQGFLYALQFLIENRSSYFYDKVYFTPLKSQQASSL